MWGLHFFHEGVVTGDEITRLVAGVQIFLAIVIAAMAINELRYFRRLWDLSKDSDHPERSYLLGAILRLNAAIVIACLWFIFSIAYRLIAGPQTWTVPISAAVLIAVLIQPRLIGQTLRRRGRLGLEDYQKEQH